VFLRHRPDSEPIEFPCGTIGPRCKNAQRQRMSKCRVLRATRWPGCWDTCSPPDTSIGQGAPNEARGFSGRRVAHLATHKRAWLHRDCPRPACPLCALPPPFGAMAPKC
jgi:hypothetical protein